MAKNNKFDLKNVKENKFGSLVMAILILAVWVGILILLIKLDVGGFGSTVLKPIFKDVPYINKILPNTDNKEEVSNYPYKSLADAITRIKELEIEVQKLKDNADIDEETIKDLQKEIERLKVFEQEQSDFYKIKTEFYNQVVLGENALSYEEYKKFYESIDPEYAEILYKQVLVKYMYDERYKELAEVYSKMKPAKAAAALYEMQGDLDKVVNIINNMDVKYRASILNALSDVDPVFCGKITVMLTPTEQN